MLAIMVLDSFRSCNKSEQSHSPQQDCKAGAAGCLCPENARSKGGKLKASFLKAISFSFGESPFTAYGQDNFLPCTGIER